METKQRQDASEKNVNTSFTTMKLTNKKMASSWIQAQMRLDGGNGKYGFDHPEYDNLRRREMEQDDYISNPPDVEEGVIECMKCGSYNVYSVSVQTRAADEPMSTRAFCTQCKTRLTQNC